MTTEAVQAIVTKVLAARPEVLEGYLFGSTARGDAQAHSDVDVAVRQRMVDALRFAAAVERALPSS
jgi:predicted nucleotidyltransferase